MTLAYTLTCPDVTPNTPVEGHSGKQYGIFMRHNGVMTAFIRDDAGVVHPTVSQKMYDRIKDDLFGFRRRHVYIVPTAHLVEDEPAEQKPDAKNAVKPVTTDDEEKKAHAQKLEKLAHKAASATPPAKVPATIPAAKKSHKKKQDSQVVRPDPHKLDTAGSIPAPATPPEPPVTPASPSLLTADGKKKIF